MKNILILLFLLNSYFYTTYGSETSSLLCSNEVALNLSSRLGFSELYSLVQVNKFYYNKKKDLFNRWFQGNKELLDIVKEVMDSTLGNELLKSAINPNSNYLNTLILASYSKEKQKSLFTTINKIKLPQYIHEGMKLAFKNSKKFSELDKKLVNSRFKREKSIPLENDEISILMFSYFLSNPQMKSMLLIKLVDYFKKDNDKKHAKTKKICDFISSMES